MKKVSFSNHLQFGGFILDQDNKNIKKYYESNNSSSSPRDSGLQILFGTDYHKWNYKQESLSLITPYYISYKIAKLTNDLYPKGIIWDMFSGIGTDAIHLANYFPLIKATELNPETCKMLEKNVKEFEQTEKIQIFNCDFWEKWDEFHPDIVYFDPPWGESFQTGKEFTFEDIKLSNGLLITEILKKIYLEKTKNIIIKCPIKCDTFEQIFENELKVKINHIFFFSKHKLKFLFVINSSKQ